MLLCILLFLKSILVFFGWVIKLAADVQHVVQLYPAYPRLSRVCESFVWLIEAWYVCMLHHVVL